MQTCLALRYLQFAIQIKRAASRSEERRFSFGTNETNFPASQPWPRLFLEWGYKQGQNGGKHIKPAVLHHSFSSKPLSWQRVHRGLCRLGLFALFKSAKIPSASSALLGLCSTFRLPWHFGNGKLQEVELRGWKVLSWLNISAEFVALNFGASISLSKDHAVQPTMSLPLFTRER